MQPYPSSQAHQMPPDLHDHPHASPYPPRQLQQLPSMPPPGGQSGYPDMLQMNSQPLPPPAGLPSDGAQLWGSQPQERAQLTPEQKRQQEANLRPYISVDAHGRKYELHVMQQPQRARMCGFGDKDRRPITPPPCVKLVIRDAKTGKEIDVNDLNYAFFVLNVNLWSADALQEVNLVRHSTATPSISSTTPASYSSLEQATPAYSHILPSMPYQTPPVMSPYMQQSPYQGGFVSPNGGGYGGAPQYYPQDIAQQLAPQASYGPPRVYEPQFGIHPRLSVSGNQPQGMFTRNLIGSLAASAFRLSDPEDKIGIWFVLQDLSVRTEGTFRLQFSFVDVGASGNGINTGKAPVLASVFSEPFQVYSAKKFPGVCDSTLLSKCFATQGIKIPIRKEGQNAKGGDGDDDDGY